MAPPDFSTANISLVAHSSTGSWTMTTLSTAASATVGMPGNVTFIAVPESEPHDQQHFKPLAGVETLSIAPLALGLTGYMAVSKAHRTLLKLLGAGPTDHPPAPFTVIDRLDDGEPQSFTKPG